MSFTRWLSKSLSPLPLLRRKTFAARLAFRPTLEALEDRWLPSTLTVTNINDSGNGTLRAEIAAAHNGDTIIFAPSLDGQTITLSTGELLINKNLAIAGPADRSVTVSGNGSVTNPSRVFEVAKTAKAVTLSGLTIRDAYFVQNTDHTVAGGAIENHGGLTISTCTLSNNVGGIGGAIDTDGTLTISNCNLNNNTAGDGGAIYCHHNGTLTVSNSNLSDNTTPKDLGGGINTDGPTTISGCTLTHNSAVSGGGIISSGPISITNCTLSNNTASDSGGGIYFMTNVYYSSFTATVSGTTLSNNSAVKGGAIYCSGPGLTLKLDGGNTLTGNSATYGGGIYVYSGALTVSGSKVGGSTAMDANVASSAGGGIYVNTYGTVTVNNSSTITGNTAPVGFGADVYNLGVLHLDVSSIIGILDGNLPS
jgi:predicted outer membrane repeat protein